MKLQDFVLEYGAMAQLDKMWSKPVGSQQHLLKKSKKKKKTETKEAPKGTYFTKSGNLVKGKLTKAAKERGARETDPKDKSRSKVPPVTQTREGKRIPRKKGQPAGSKKHSDLYTDENPKGTIQGLKFATVADAKASVSKIRSSGKKHAHKIQAAVAMEQRAKAAGKSSAAAVYRTFINKMKKKTQKMKKENAIMKGVEEGTRCWKGYKKKGMKTMFGKRVPNCVKNEDNDNDNVLPLNKAAPDQKGPRVGYPPYFSDAEAERAAYEYNTQAQIDQDDGVLITSEDGKKYRIFRKEDEYSDPQHFEPGEVYLVNDDQTNPKEYVDTDGYPDVEELLHHHSKQGYYVGMDENFADGKKKGKSRPGRVKRSGASCKGSVTSLRKKAKNSSGEKSKMYHWCANMKSGKKKK